MEKGELPYIDAMRFLSIRNSYLILCLALSVHITAHAASVNSAEMQYSITRFQSSNPNEATVIELAPAGDGTLKTVDLSNSIKLGNCEDFLSGFQKRPLEEMYKRKYISREMRDALLNITKLGIRLEQMVLINQFTDMTRAQAEALFNGHMPEDRYKVKDHARDAQGRPIEILRVQRGTLYVVRGYEVVLEGSTPTLKPLKVPWELDDPLASNLLRPFDRTRVTPLAEFGRAFVESEGAPGHLQQMVHVMVAALAQEANVLKVPLDQYVISAHFLDPQHSRLFALNFPIRPLNRNLQAAMENNVVEGLNTAFAQPLPKGNEWDAYANTVMVGNLNRALQKYTPETISHAAKVISRDSQGRISNVEALSWHSHFISAYRQGYRLQMNGMQSSNRPIVLRDFGSPLVQARLRSKIEQVMGTGHSDNELEAWTDDATGTSGDPDLMNSFWVNRGIIFIPMDLHHQVNTDGSAKPYPYITINNLDPMIANQYPMLYLASTLLATEDLVRKRIESLNPREYLVVRNDLNEARKKRGQTPVFEVTVVDFLNAFPLVVTGKADSIQAQARNLGAEVITGMEMNLNLDLQLDPQTGSARASMQMPIAQFSAFRSPSLKYLRDHWHELFPNIEIPNAKNMKPELWDIRLRMALSGSL